MIRTVPCYAFALIFILLSCRPGMTETVAAKNADRDTPLLGAIRWDAWYGKIPENVTLRDPKSYPGVPENLSISRDPGAETLRSLSMPKVWQWRLPWFTEFDADGRVVEINENRTEILEEEIELASGAGLDYWAFTLFPEDCPLSYTLKTYLSCKNREKMKFCLFFVLQEVNYGSFTEDPEMQEYVLRLVTRPEYLKVLGNRPVLYVGFLHEKVEERLRSGFWKTFCDRIQAEGLGRPYVILCSKNPAGFRSLFDTIQADAVSSYNAGADGRAEGAPYSELARNAERFWDHCKESGYNVAPICMTGWDKRPRFLNPVSWETNYKKGQRYERCYLQGTPKQIAEHIGRSFDWLEKNPNRDDVRLSLIYAWNEFDEGGWLAPMLPPPRGEGNARLEALKNVLETELLQNIVWHWKIQCQTIVI